MKRSRWQRAKEALANLWPPRRRRHKRQPPRAGSPSASPAARLQLLSSNLGPLLRLYKDEPVALMQLLQQAVWQTFIHHLQILLMDETHTLLGYEMKAVLLVGGLPAVLADETRLEELKELMGMDGLLQTVVEARISEKMREVIVGGLSEYGHRFTEYVGLLARYEPNLYGRVAEEISTVLMTWVKGFNATRRADEAEGRARYFLWVMEQEPNLARVAANNVLKLPPGHPLRDEARIRDALNGQLQRAVDAVAASGTDGDDIAWQTSIALDAIAGLIEHELVSSSRIQSLLNAGRSLLKSPHLQDNGGTFRQAAASYLVKQARQAHEGGETKLADRHNAEAIELFAPLVDAESDPVRKQLMSIMLYDAAEESDKVEETIRAMVVDMPQEGKPEAAHLFAVRLEAKHAFLRQQYDRVIALLSPVRSILEEQYLSSVLEADVATTGQALAEVLTHLAFAYAHEDDWENALIVLDRGKSLRLRYQALLRTSPLGDFLREIEADIHAQARGVAPPTARQLNLSRSLTDLLETYRQAREKIGFDELQSPRVADIAARLAPDEAVVILGDGPTGLLLAVIRPGDDGRPSVRKLLPSQDRGKFLQALTNPVSGWLFALSPTTRALVEPRNALQPLLDTVDRILGHPLAAMLEGMSVCRLTVIPHQQLHMVPFWALPSLASYQVMLAPSAAQFVAARKGPRRLEPRALVVGNPTNDLKLAAVEARRVAYHLRKNGCAVDLIDGSAATEATLAQQVADASFFHFSGHGRSDLFTPTRSALEVHPGTVSGTTEGHDLLLNLAAQADWQPVHRLAGTEWIHDHNEHWADFPGRGRLIERFYPGARRIELRLEHEAQGTLLGRYEWRTDAEDDKVVYGERQRLSEMWTAGDILTDNSLRNCGFAFLSSCDAGSSGLSFFVDEFAGLPAALQLAGVATVISPLWPVGVEVAALFADLFYGALTAFRGEVDVLALVKQTQQQLRHMNRDQADAVIARLSEGVKDRMARLLLDAARSRIQQSNERYPFAHPYDWAAFHVAGAPNIIVPFTGLSETDAASEVSTLTVAAAANGSAAIPSAAGQPAEPSEPDTVTEDKVFGDGTEATEASLRPGDVFELGEEAEKLVELTDDKALKPLAAEFIYKRGLAHERAQEMEQALADFARAVELDPLMVQAHIRLGRLYAARQNQEKALGHYEMAIAQDPNNATALISRGLVYRDLEDIEAAIVDLERAFALEPDEDNAYLIYKTRAEIYLETGLYDQAVADFTQALTLHPEDAVSYLKRAFSYQQQDRPTEVIADVQRALLFLPEAAVAYNMRGLALLGSEEYERAVADFDKALELDPVMVEALYNRGLAYSDMQDYPLAIASFDAAIKLSPGLPELYTSRGLAYAYRGQYDRAITDYNQALVLDPDHIAALYNRACAYSMKQEAGSIVADLTFVFQRDLSLVDHAQSDPDLEWARQTFPNVRTLLALE